MTSLITFWHSSSWWTRVSGFYLLVLFIIGLMANVLANEHRGWFSTFGPDEIAGQSKIFSPPGQSLPDGRIFHLGTDNMGRDVLSRLIHGIRPALIIGTMSMLMGLFLALILGGMAGYFGNKLTLRVLTIVFMCCLWLFILYQLWHLQFVDGLGHLYRPITAVLAYLLFGLIASYGLLKLRVGPNMRIPLDRLLIKLLEVKRSIPTLMLFIVVLALTGPLTIVSISIVIGLFSWSTMARVCRAQFMKYREEDFVLAARGMGLSDWHIATKQILPNVLPSVLVVAAFNVGAAILVESSLSFLQFGLDGEVVSLGRMLAQSRDYFQAWWVVLPPGFIIFSLIFTINSLAEHLQDRRN